MSVHPHRSSRGVTLIEMIIALAVIAVVFVGIAQGVEIYRDYLKGKDIATAFKPYYQAALDYTHAYRKPLTGTGTMPAVADPYRPTIAELKTLGILGSAYTGSLPSVTGSPTVELTLIPSGCSGTACDIGIAVTFPAAVKSGSFPAYRALTFAAREFGSDAGFSTYSTPGTITSVNWSRTNPLGSVEGVFGTYVTYSASGLAQYLVVSDTRDPNFINNVTVGGNVIVTGNVGSGSGSSGGTTCQLSELMNSGGVGQVAARAADCVTRVFVDGGTGSVQTRTATGGASVTLGGDGSITSYTSTGSTGAGVSYSGTVSTVFGDNIQNSTNTGGINSSGKVYGTDAAFSGIVSISGTQTAGSACTSAGQFSRQTDGQLLECVSSVWRLAGLVRSTEGSACTDGLALDSTTASTTLFCRGGVYVSLNSALGRIAWLDSQSVVDGSTVAAPTCGTGATAILQVVPSQFQTPVAGGAVRYSYTGSGPWTISISGASGAEAIAWRGCQYTSL